MKRWRAPRTAEPILCLLGSIGLVALTIMGGTRLLRAAQGPIDLWPITIAWLGIVVGCIAAIVAAVALLWRALQTLSLHYTLDRNAITVHRRGSRYIVPLDQIRAMSYGEAGAVPRDRRLIRFGRGRPAQTLHITTTAATYALAVAERGSFAHELEQRQRLGSSQFQREGPTYRHRRWISFSQATTVQRLARLGLVLNLLIWAVLTWRYSTLPDTVPIRWDPLGGTAGTRSRGYTLLLPAVATAFWLGNLLLAGLLYARSRLASELLLLGTIIVQLVSLAAVWFVVRGL